METGFIIRFSVMKKLVPSIILNDSTDVKSRLFGGKLTNVGFPPKGRDKAFTIQKPCLFFGAF